MQLADYTYQNQIPTWCPGCGNFFVLQALKKSLAEGKIAPKNAVVTYDIGCGGNMINVLKVCGFATLHGRSIPVAVGVKKANPNLTVLAQGGDGGLLNEGTNHLIHAAQRNDNITVLLHNNLVFALTTGQTSYATPKGLKTKSNPQGNLYVPLSALALAAQAGAGFLARSYAFDIEKTAQIIRAAIQHQGFSLVEIIMPCLIWSKSYDKKYFQNHVFDSDEKLVNREQLLSFLAVEREKIPLGIFWNNS